MTHQENHTSKGQAMSNDPQDGTPAGENRPPSGGDGEAAGPHASSPHSSARPGDPGAGTPGTDNGADTTVSGPIGDSTGTPDPGQSAAGPERLPSGALKLDDSVEGENGKKNGVSRRKVLLGTGIGAAVVAAGGFGGWTFVRGRQSSLADGQLTIISGGEICSSPVFAAYENGYFEERGLNVQVRLASQDEDTHAAVGSGTYAAAPGIFFSWLKPIEQGVDAKLVAGLHEGCLRLVVLEDGPITRLEDLRGGRIGVSGLQSSALNFFSLDLLDAGIVPSPEAGEVEWVVYENDLLPEALSSGEVDAIAAADPIALLPTLDGPAVELTNNRQGQNAQEFCCATALNGGLVREHPDVARDLVTAWAEGSRWVGANIEEAAELVVEKNYVAGDPAEIIPILQTYSFQPSANRLRDALIPGIEKFAGTGFLDERTVAEELADRVYADLGLNW